MTWIEEPVEIPVDGARLAGDLDVPAEQRGVVVFAHGSGSGRFSPRNRAVAAGMRAGGLGTLLLDLLSSEEEAEDLRTRRLRFDIPLLAERVVGAIDWLGARPETSHLPIGCFGASTGAAAALIAAADRPGRVSAVVSRGGRPDLAGEALRRVTAPTLLIVGGADTEVIALNRAAGEAMSPDVDVRLEIVPGAGHLFEEPGSLEQVTASARDWFAAHLRPAG